MDEGQEKPEDYAVGYGKPPKHTQFKKGQSGNPTGKRKKEVSVWVKLQRLADEEVMVQQNGVPVAMTRGEAVLTAVFVKAMKGDLGAAKFITENLGPRAETDAGAEVEVTEADLAVLETQADWRGLLERSRAEMNADNDDWHPDGDEDDEDPS